MSSEEKKDDRKWVGVRISKPMMHQVEEVIDRHPEFAYTTPNDFIRDATRRHIEYVLSVERQAEANLEKLPDKVESIIEEAVGDSLARDFEKEIDKLLTKFDPNEKPDEFMDGLKKLLASTFGPTMAEAIANKILEENGT